PVGEPDRPTASLLQGQNEEVCNALSPAGHSVLWSFCNHSRIIVWRFPQPCIVVFGFQRYPTHMAGPAGTATHHLKGGIRWLTNIAPRPAARRPGSRRPPSSS